jgi:hypothetical protein
MTTTVLSWPNPKDPGDVLDYTLDITKVIDPDAGSPTGDTIATVTWTVPSGLTKMSQLESGGKASVWLAGGTSGRIYTLNADCITVQGRTVNRDIQLMVAER